MRYRLTGAGIRVISTAATVAFTLMVLVVTCALLLLTAKLHRATELVRESVTGVRLAEEAQIGLNLHDRAELPFVRAATEADLLRTLTEAGRHVASREEQRRYDRAWARIQEYLLAVDRGADPPERAKRLELAYDALERLVNAKVAQANAAQRSADRLDKAGDVVGVTAATVMLVVLAILFLLFRRAVVLPILALDSAMERFGRGDAGARSEERGAAELRGIARRFNAIADALARQNDLRVAYLAGVAHDLRNPLAALQLSASAIGSGGPLPPEDRLRQAMAVVDRQVTRLNRMVGDLLETVRIEAGHLSLHVAEHDLSQIVRDVVQLFEGTSLKHDLCVELPERPVVVRCDPVRIEQTLSNLVSNAIKYSPRGGPVLVSVRLDVESAVVSVTDQGLGIPTEDLEAIWEPFRRSGASKELVAGVGLGLSSARRIVAAHGGTISVRSVLGIGSTFSFSLPFSPPSEQSEQSKLPEPGEPQPAPA